MNEKGGIFGRLNIKAPCRFVVLIERGVRGGGLSDAEIDTILDASTVTT